MKNQLFLSGIMSAFLIIFAPKCPANVVDQLLCDVHPFLGIDLQERHMDFDEKFGGNLFKRNLPQYDIYAGVRFLKYFGLQVGYEQSRTKSRTADFAVGDSFLGLILAPGEDQVHISDTKVRGSHIDFLGFLPLCSRYNLDLFGSIGVVRNILSLHDTGIIFNGIVEDTPLVRTYDIQKTSARATIGIQKLFCANIGIRALVAWEDTSRFKDLKPLENPLAETNVNAKRSFNYGVGIFATL